MRRAVAVALLVIVAAAQRLGAQADVDSLAARVRKVTDAYLAAYFERHPDEATLDGASGVRHDRLPDNSPVARGRWQAREDRWLAELRRIDPAPLVGRPEWTAYGVMRASLEGSAATRACRYELWNVSHVNRGWLPIITSLAAVQPVGTEELRQQALTRWREIPLYIASEMANQREGLRLGFSAPQGNVRIVIKQLDQLLDERIDRSPLYGPALRDSAPAFDDELRRFITNAVVPTIRQYRQFLAKEYLPRARKVIGVSANPNGAVCYRGTIQATTGLALSPDSIHRHRGAGLRDACVSLEVLDSVVARPSERVDPRVHDEQRGGQGEIGERPEARRVRGIDPHLVGELLGVFAPTLAEPWRPEVAGDRRDSGAPLERDRPLQVVSGDRLVEGERLDVRPGLVLRVVRAEVEDPGPAVVLRRRVPFEIGRAHV